MIAKATGATLPAVPAAPPAIQIPEFKLGNTVSLWKTLPEPTRSEELLSMEDLGQTYGYILYRTHLKSAAKVDLVIEGLHDYAQIITRSSQIAKRSITKEVRIP